MHLLRKPKKSRWQQKHGRRSSRYLKYPPVHSISCLAWRGSYPRTGPIWVEHSTFAQNPLGRRTDRKMNIAAITFNGNSKPTAAIHHEEKGCTYSQNKYLLQYTIKLLIMMLNWRCGGYTFYEVFLVGWFGSNNILLPRNKGTMLLSYRNERVSIWICITNKRTYHPQQHASFDRVGWR